MQMSALSSVPVMASSRLCLRSPLSAIRPGTAPRRTRLMSCRAQTRDYMPQSETQVQGKTEPMVYKAIKVACLLPAVAALLWAGPAHAKKSRQPAAAAQVMEVQSAETHSAAEQLQAKWEQLMLQLQTGSLQQQVTAELKNPDVQKGLAAVAGLLLVAMLWKGSSGSSKATTTSSSSSSGSDGSSSNGSGSSNAAAPAASLAAAASRAIPATSAKQPVDAAAAASSPAMSDAVSAQEILQVVKEAADKVSASAAATASEVSASAAAAAAAVERAQAVTDKAHSSLSRSTSPDVPEPPKLVKPSLTAAAAAPAVNKAAAAASSNGNGNGAAAATGRRSRPPSPIPILPERGAATPALAVLGAGALLLDFMAPLGKLAAASVSRQVSRSSSPVSSTGESTAGGSNGAASSAESSRSAVSAAPAAAAATPAVQEVRRPSTPSKLAKAVERAAAEAAAVPRTVPTELPPVTLKELEEALKAGQKV